MPLTCLRSRREPRFLHCAIARIDKRQAYRIIETLQNDFKFLIDKDKAIVGGEVRYYLDKDHFKRFRI
jgi:hypothetical protein